jgi:hypothetical protein
MKLRDFKACINYWTPFRYVVSDKLKPRQKIRFLTKLYRVGTDRAFSVQNDYPTASVEWDHW